MFLIGILAFEDAFPECTVTPYRDDKYVFQTIKIPKGECFTTNQTAMIGTYLHKTKFNVSYKTSTKEGDQIKLSNEIKYETENPIFLNSNSTNYNYYKISAVNASEDMYLYYMVIDESRDRIETYIVNSYEGKLNINSGNNKRVIITFLMKHQSQSITFDSNRTIELVMDGAFWTSEQQTVTSNIPSTYWWIAKEPTNTKIKFNTPSFSHIFDSNQLPYYSGVVPPYNGPISYKEATDADYNRERAIQDEIDASYYSECKYSYTKDDILVKTFNLKHGECLKSSTPMIISGDKNYHTSGIFINNVRKNQGTFQSNNPLFISVNDDQSNIYSKTICSEESDCKIQVSKIMPTTSDRTSYVSTTSNGTFSGKVTNKQPVGYSFISLKPLSLYIESQNDIYISRKNEQTRRYIKQNTTIATNGSDSFEIGVNVKEGDYKITVSEGKSSYEDEEFLFPQYTGKIPDEWGAISIDGVEPVKAKRGNSKSKEISTGLIVLYALLAFVVVGTIIAVIVCFVLNKKKAEQSSQTFPQML
ncbi:hypothetical protein TVAG_409120 [Trichomonas vaginalis G3]|uniref:Uncharacterized protein n=1 Tax=Trichomonas vaginalis (strain ATCC PRA-98 / G3) TaxID=412133 RepID=A2G2Q2_TRIV3|nr:uncharacterized protein TVAGG3_1077730 [Trichomonas vaginalis G3]EAX88560.1 hypothetical protein TVAG_409120 [Trichomonas vaginalis G3]KAI5482799.1 hypothetical protein TVAGG3_1077730 [Trichomonas vaginalis G3]|eukprot:XP_001301490.1 hypothetical protein [Trichomonas vaginalis G3]